MLLLLLLLLKAGTLAHHWFRGGGSGRGRHGGLPHTLGHIDYDLMWWMILVVGDYDGRHHVTTMMKTITSWTCRRDSQSRQGCHWNETILHVLQYSSELYSQHNAIFLSIEIVKTLIWNGKNGKETKNCSPVFGVDHVCSHWLPKTIFLSQFLLNSQQTNHWTERKSINKPIKTFLCWLFESLHLCIFWWLTMPIHFYFWPYTNVHPNYWSSKHISPDSHLNILLTISTLLTTLIPRFGSQPHCPPSKSILG